MINIRRLFLQKAIFRCMSKLAPSSFKYAYSNDYYVPIIKRENDPNDVLIDSFDGDLIVGREWDGNQFNSPIEFTLEELNKAEIEVTRFIGTVTIKYSSLGDFWRGEVTQLALRFRIKERIKQLVFNSTTRFRHDRMSILQTLVADHLKPSEQTPINAILGDEYFPYTTLFEKVYGQRAFGHPSYSEEIARFEFILLSLVATDDLQHKDNLSFKVTPKALVTIAEYEQAERMHRDNVVHNRYILFLTIILVATTVIQAYSAFSANKP